MNVGIVGAGILGKLCALRLGLDGWRVTLFDRGQAQASCSYTAAGLLSPFCEMDISDVFISKLGIASLDLWPRILRELESPVFFQQAGTLIVSHPGDASELKQIQKKVSSLKNTEVRPVCGSELKALEPELDPRFSQALYFPTEAQIDTREVLKALETKLLSMGTSIYTTEISEVSAHEIRNGHESWSFDWVIDARGMGARSSLPSLRGVRGEIIRLHAPDVSINRPIRLAHPRYPLYLAPRPRGEFVVGATSIESEDPKPITVRSTMELLSAAFSIHSGFGEATISETSVQWRPALSNNLPRIFSSPGILRMNGLYRNGYLISPRIVECAAQFLTQGTIPASYEWLFEEQ